MWWEAVRCLIRVCARAAAAFEIPAWRKHADRTRKVYKAFQRVRTAPRYWRNRKGVKAYLRQCKRNATSVRALLRAMSDMEETAPVQEEIAQYLQRRWWIKSGVAYWGVRRVRMRRRCFPFTSRIRGGSAKARRGCCLSWAFRSRCDHQFILAHQIMWDRTDRDVAVPIIDAVQAVFPEFNACSFDRGFYSSDIVHALLRRMKEVTLPKMGTRNQADRVCESAPAFKAARRQHPAIESCLANFGLRGGALVREKSPEHFALMVSLSVLAVNVHRLGCLVRDQCGASVSEDARRRPTTPPQKCLTHVAPSTRDTYALLVRIQHHSSRTRPAPAQKRRQPGRDTGSAGKRTQKTTANSNSRPQQEWFSGNH